MQKKFIKKYFKLAITPADANIKFQCTNKYNINTADALFNAFQNVRGNIKETDKSVSFNDLLYTAVNYFFDAIHGNIVEGKFIPHKVKDEFYTINYIKTCFDNCNLTNYTPKDRLIGNFVNLENHQNDSYYTECYLIIQTAYFYATRFGMHQFLEYTEHFATTGKKLPIENYKHDVDVLEKKYIEITEDKTTLTNSISNYLYLWYFSALEIIIDNSKIKNSNFRQSEKNNQHRIYNAVAMCPRTLRYEQPFKLVECDISTAYPTMIDEYLGSRIAPTLYDNLAKNKGISRNDAKTLFNRNLNKKKYRPLHSRQRDDYFSFLLSCGYSEIQGIKIITELTDNKDLLFFDRTSEREKKLIEKFKEENNINNGTRLHDALIFIHENNIDYNNLTLTIDKIFNFKVKVLNEPILNNTFYNSRRFIKRKSISFAHKETGLSNTHVGIMPKVMKGRFVDSIDVVINEGSKKEIKQSVNLDVTFYNGSYNFINANFKTETYNKDTGLEHLIKDYNDLKNKIINSCRIIKYINGKNLTIDQLRTILKRYRKLSNLCFDVDTLQDDVLKSTIDDLKEEEIKNLIQKRDYTINNNVKCDNDYIFNIALNIAKAKVNDAFYLNLILEWFKDNPHSFLSCDDIGLNKGNKRLKNLINDFNLLFTGSKNFNSRTVFSNKSSTYDKYLLKYYGNHAKTVRDNSNKTRNMLRLNKLKDKIDKLKNDIDIIKTNQSIILEYFNNHNIKKQEVLSCIKTKIDINYILDLRQKTFEVAEVVAEENPIFETDLTKSIFYTKTPNYKDFINANYLTGYDKDFYKFHKENISDVLCQLKNGSTKISPEPTGENIFFVEIPPYKSFNKKFYLTWYQREFYKYHQYNWHNVINEIKQHNRVTWYDVSLLKKIA